MSWFGFLHGPLLPVLPPGLDEAARQLVVTPVPEALVPNIHVHGFEIPATREAISADELHTDPQRDRDPNKTVRMRDRSTAQSSPNASRIAKSGITSVQYRGPKQCPPHQTAYLESSRK